LTRSKNCRVVHGSSASDYCLWQEEGDHGNGNPIHLWTRRDVNRFACCWNERGTAPCSHSAGMVQRLVNKELMHSLSVIISYLRAYMDKIGEN
jgi:hypothetical protein